METEKKESRGGKPARFRKQLLLPAEHGSWSWLLVPFFVGAGVAGSWGWPAALTLIGGLAAFLLRQPATAWLRARSGRGRRSDGPLAARLTAGLAGAALFCLVGLLLFERYALLWLTLPLAGLLLLYLAAGRQKRATLRTLWLELVGAAGLALMAPAAYVAVDGRFDQEAWIIWLLMAAQNMLGVLYVRLRIADTHDRPMRRTPVLWGHGAALLGVLLLAALTLIPWAVLGPFGAFLGRAIWAVRMKRPVANIKRFGFTEVGVEIAAGVWIIAGYWLS